MLGQGFNLLFCIFEFLELKPREVMKWNVGVESMEWCEEIEDMEMRMSDMREVARGIFEM